MFLWGFYTPVTERGHEVEATVNSIVFNVLSIQSTLVFEVLIELCIDVHLHRLPPAHIMKHNDVTVTSLQNDKQCYFLPVLSC